MTVLDPQAMHAPMTARELLRASWACRRTLPALIDGRPATPALLLEWCHDAEVRMRAETRAQIVETLRRFTRVRGAAPAEGDIVDADDPRFPDQLRELAQPLHGLSVRGDADVLGLCQPRVGIIGSRQPMGFSRDVADSIAWGVARAGCTVVSGLAIGIDGVAHAAALRAGGRTIAVLGSGIDCVHPASNRGLAGQIAARGGLLVSEYPPHQKAARHQFRDRNRIIAALCDLLVVVQARRPSGSMITVDQAIQLGVEVAAVPARPGDVAYDGSLALLRDGAHVVTDAADVLLIVTGSAPDLAGGGGLGSGSGTLAERLGDGMHVDEILTMTGRSTIDLLAELAQLEAAGLVARRDDGRYVAARGLH